MNRIFLSGRALLAIAMAATLVACGGGDGGPKTVPTAGAPTGGSPPVAATGFSQTYAASATAGEVLQYTVNTQNLTYSYTVTNSAYGCEVVTAPCHSGAGTLVKNADGTYSPSESPASKILPMQNGLLIGHARMQLGGVEREVPIFGVSNPATTGPSVAGTYNFISLQCYAKSYGNYAGCYTYQGTVRVTSTGPSTASYQTCVGADISAGTVCTTPSTGTLTHTTGGIWQFVRTGSTNVSHFIGFTAPNGQKVGVIDFNDPGFYGYGQGIVSSNTSAMAAADVYGTYFAKNSVGGNAVFSVDAGGSHFGGSTVGVTYNAPWRGMATTSNGGTAMMAGNGVYAYRNPYMGYSYFEIGARID